MTRSLKAIGCRDVIPNQLSTLKIGAHALKLIFITGESIITNGLYGDWLQGWRKGLKMIVMMTLDDVHNIMLKFINRGVKAPLSYIADLRAISFKQYLLISTNFSPSYPIMIFTALGFTLMYCSILIYYVFTSNYSEICYKDVHGAAYLISILYPI